MSLKPLGLPTAIETLVFRAITNRLDKDPTLSRVLKSKQFYTGDKDDLSEIEEKQLPYLSVYPAPLGDQVQTEQHSNSHLAINITLAVDGTNFDDLLNLYAAVRKCLKPGDQSMQTIINSTKCNNNRDTWGDLFLKQPAYNLVAKKTGSQMWVGSGSVVCRLWVSSGN